MKAIRAGVVLVVGSALCAALISPMPAALAAQSTVDDETSLMSDSAIAQINARNQQLFAATGLVVAVVVVRGSNEETALPSAAVAADKIAKGYYGAVVWVATGGEKSDILFTGKALKWIPYHEQTSLQHDLSYTIRYCCPSDTLPGIVDQIASAMETGSKSPPSPRNYVNDQIGVLNGPEIEQIVARDQRLEAATGKGVAVVLFSELPGKASGVLAYALAQTLNVNGQVAALVWVAKGQQASHFAMIQAPNFDTIPEAMVTSIGNSFQGDVQAGDFGQAIVAAVDRTATAIEGTSTPMPSQASAAQIVQPASPQAAEPSATNLAAPQPAPRSSGNGTAVVIFLVLAIAVLFVTMALRQKYR